MPSRYEPTAPRAPAQRAARPLELPLEPRCTFYTRQLSYAEQMRPARGRGWIVMVHWGLVQLGRHGQARCALRLRPRAATTVRPEWPESCTCAPLVTLWRHRAALRRLGLPARARAEAGGRGGGKGRRVLRGLGCLAQIFPHLGSQARLAQVAAHAQRRCAAARAAPRTGAAPRRLPVAAHAGTGASVADATFLVGISSRRSIGAAEPLMLPTRQSLAPPLPGCSPPATALPRHHS